MTQTPPRRRVLHVITRLIVGGAQENTLASVVRVDPSRYDSHLWIGPQTGQEGSLLDTARAQGVRPVVIPDLVRELHPWRDSRALADLVRRLRAEPFDVIHTHSSKAGFLGRAAARLTGVPIVIYTQHGWSFHPYMSPAKRALYVRAERLAARWTHRLVCVSEDAVSTGLQAGIGREQDYVVIRSGIPLDEFGPSRERRRALRAELGFAEEDVLVGSVGRLSAQKNPIDFVRLAERVVAGAPRARFVYVGDGPLRGAVEERLAKSPARERVRLLGLRDDVPDLLRTLDLFVMTSLWEGLPRVVPQALATGVPVASYDVAGTREIVRDGSNGYLVRAGDVDALAEVVRALVQDDERRRELATRAVRDFDRSFSEDEMIRGLERLYDELCERRLR